MDTVYRAHALAVFGAGLTDQNADSRPAKQNTRYIPRSQRPSSCHADAGMGSSSTEPNAGTQFEHVDTTTPVPMVESAGDPVDLENSQSSPYPHDVPNEQEQTLEENDTGCVPASAAPDHQGRLPHWESALPCRLFILHCCAFWKLPSSDMQHSDFPCAFLLFRFVIRTH